MKDEFKNALHKLRESYKSDERFAWNESNINLNDTFDDLVFSRAGGACPVQAEGSYQGQPFYFRYRWGFASLGLGGENPILHPEYSSSLSHGDSFDGFLSSHEFKNIFTKMLQSIISQQQGEGNGA